jgi:hypothetical protein
MYTFVLACPGGGCRFLRCVSRSPPPRRYGTRAPALRRAGFVSSVITPPPDLRGGVRVSVARVRG